MRVALIHDWLLNTGGAEKVLRSLHNIFPEAPIYTLFHDKKFIDSFLPGANIHASFVQPLFKFFKSHQFLAPLMPLAIESFDFSEFDLVISSSVSFSKGIILKPKTLHVCYCHSPTRQVWDWHAEYKKEKHKTPRLIVALWQHLSRIWDFHSASRVDYFIANSKNVADRIRKYYGRESSVIYPPVSFFDISSRKIESIPYTLYPIPFFLIVSRLFPSKNVDLAVKAFNKLGWPLIVIGDGPELGRLQKMAQKNVRFLGYQSDEIVSDYYADCSGFIMPQEEDFGITPIEAMSYGKPVLALRRGGALEYIEEGINGEFFDDAVPEVLADGVRRMKEDLSKYNPEKVKRTAERFSEERFKKELLEFVEKVSQV